MVLQLLLGVAALRLVIYHAEQTKMSTATTTVVALVMMFIALVAAELIGGAFTPSVDELF